ncbi:amino acid ABC transporter permease [Alloyangia pacifica]|uniref:Polar amino acid transport system permease protein n=1 Tax=Alloyangia pacifica TaxID=311180 RepID=A0A1I6VHG5_9RHOB|nr:amino acid ABC transporter permease [Alloyangia pacifica]SDH98139.1 polar amino acid transport system permease protein [Alloyangia pacifica]SFT13087.1 polar amino acid transport system permease protein [Alloyangia pacifica]
MDMFLQTFLNLEILKMSFPFLLKGLGVTLLLSAVVVPVGVGTGVLMAVLAKLGSPALRRLLTIWVDFFRAFPSLVLLILIYYGLPFFELNMGVMGSVVLAMVLNVSAYFAEIFRAGISSVPHGQIEAARATGLRALQVMAHVQLPQATRNMMPDIVTNIVETIKMTSLASIVTLPELLQMARMAQGSTYSPTPLVLAAGMYFALLFPMVQILNYLENRKAGA